MPKRKSTEDISPYLPLYLQQIRNIREDHDLTQKAVADHLNVKQETYSGYERGKTRLSAETLIKLAEYYDADMNYICGFTKIKHPFPGRNSK